MLFNITNDSDGFYTVMSRFDQYCIVLAIDRQTVIIVLHSCTCTLAAAVFIRGGPAKPTYNRPNCNFLIAFECIDKIQ